MTDRHPRPHRRCGAAFHTLLVLLVVGAIAITVWKTASPSHALAGWLHSLDEGIDASERDGKPVLVLFTADWCPPCRQLKSAVLTKPDIDAYLRERYTPVKIDLTDRNSPNNALAQEYNVRGIPTMIAYDHNGLEVDRIVGGTDQATFTQWLDTCLAQNPG